MDAYKEKKTKRIIEKIEGLATYVTIPRELAIYNVNIDSQEAKLLIDYITNLQQQYEGAILVGKELNKENERLKWDKEQLNSLVNSCQEEIRKLKSEKKHAVDFINKHKKEITKEDTTIFNEDREDKSKLKVGTFMWHVDELIDKLNGKE